MQNSDYPESPFSRRRLLTAGATLVGAAALVADGATDADSQTAPITLGEFAWGDGIRRIKSAGKIVFGMSASMIPPQYYRDPHTNQPMGYDVEVANLIAADLGVTPDFQEAVVAARVIGLQSGKYDVVLAGTANSPARAGSIAFTRGYLPYQQVLVIPKNSPIKSADQLNDPKYTITAQIGSTAEYSARQMFPKATINPLEIQEAMLEVASGRAEADLVERYLAEPFVGTHPSTTLLGGLTSPFITSVEYGCVACRLSEMGLRQWLDNWVYWYDTHGVLPAMYDRIMKPTSLP